MLIPFSWLMLTIIIILIVTAIAVAIFQWGLSLKKYIDEQEQKFQAEKEQRRIAEQKLMDSLTNIQILLNMTQTANEIKDHFFANLSFEIRDPLNAIIGASEILNSSELPSEERKFVQIIYRNADFLFNNINNILDFAKISSGKEASQMESFSLTDLTEELLRPYKERAHAKHILLNWQIDPKIPSLLSGAKSDLKKILTNLIDNALKFTISSGAIHIQAKLHHRKHVTPQKQEHSVNILFEISDTGIGIPKEYHELIFTPFSKLELSMESSTGTGVGLALCRELLSRINGKIWVESTPGEGSHFFFIFPFQRPESFKLSA